MSDLIIDDPTRFKERIMRGLLEDLASLEHQQWGHFFRHMKANWNEDNIKRWTGQAYKRYEQLTEAEKESDREWARKVIKILGAYEQ
jgi:hypothetical protein